MRRVDWRPEDIIIPVFLAGIVDIRDLWNTPASLPLVLSIGVMLGYLRRIADAGCSLGLLASVVLVDASAAITLGVVGGLWRGVASGILLLTWAYSAASRSAEADVRRRKKERRSRR